MLPLLIVRPEPGASATLRRAQALGIDAQSIPLFTIAPVGWTPPEVTAFDALLISSANAVRHAGPELAALSTLPAYAVGPTTAAAVTTAGLMLMATGDAGAQAMVDAMIANGARNILWLCGSDRSALLPGAARITPLATYRATALSAPPAWDAAIAHPAVLLLHSARAARRAAELAGPARKHLIALAISAAVADAAGTGWRRCVSATRPDDSEMLALARQLCQMNGI